MVVVVNDTASLNPRYDNNRPACFPKFEKRPAGSTCNLVKALNTIQRSYLVFKYSVVLGHSL